MEARGGATQKREKKGGRLSEPRRTPAGSQRSGLGGSLSRPGNRRVPTPWSPESLQAAHPGFPPGGRTAAAAAAAGGAPEAETGAGGGPRAVPCVGNGTGGFGGGLASQWDCVFPAGTAPGGRVPRWRRSGTCGLSAQTHLFCLTLSLLFFCVYRPSLGYRHDARIFRISGGNEGIKTIPTSATPQYVPLISF